MRCIGIFALESRNEPLRHGKIVTGCGQGISKMHNGFPRQTHKKLQTLHTFCLRIIVLVHLVLGVKTLCKSRRSDQ